MGCGALSSNSQIHTPQLQYKKSTFNYKSQQTEVWQCFNNEKQKFSMKVFKKIFITEDNANSLKNFQTQINRLNELTKKKQYQNYYTSKLRKNIMEYIRAWKDQNGNLALIMKHKDNFEPKSLADQVKGKLPGLFKQIQIAKVTKQAILTIKFLRQNGSLFCNFKPSNIFLDKTRQNITICDYYNLEEYFKVEQLGILKNPIYSAPQNVLFKQSFQQTDVWRIGCFVLQMLTCIKPWYKQTTDKQKIIQHLRNKQIPPIPQKISLPCKYFLSKCFESDHNRRASLDELLQHQFLNSQNLPVHHDLLSHSKVDNQYKVLKNSSRQNKSSNRNSKQNSKKMIQNAMGINNIQEQQNSQIGSYNLQIRVDQSSPVIKQLKKSRMNVGNGSTISIEDMTTPTQNRKQSKKDFTISKKKSLSHSKANEKKNIMSNYNGNRSIMRNNQNSINNTSDLKNSKYTRNKRMKTDLGPSGYSSYNNPLRNYQNSPQRQSNQNQQSAYLYKPKILNQAEVLEAYSPPASNKKRKESQNLNAPNRKISKTSNFRLSASKKNIIPTNQIMLNNQVLTFENTHNVNQNSSSKYWPAPQVPAPFDYLQTAQKLHAIMKQIELQGGNKYYKKPLKLLKSKLRNKTTTFRTQTSITFQGTEHPQQSQNFIEQDNQIQEVDLESNRNEGNVGGNLISDQSVVYNQTQNSKLSYNRQYEVIETMASKAQKQRYQTQQKMLRQQRQNQKLKWEKQLKQGRQFIKNQINQRYHFMRGKDKIFRDHQIKVNY